MPDRSENLMAEESEPTLLRLSEQLIDSGEQSSGETGFNIEQIDTKIQDRHEAIPSELRKQILERDDYRCQINGCPGSKHNGSAELVVQPIGTLSHSSREGVGPSELETRCMQCSRWIARMPAPDDLPREVKDRLNGVEVKRTWAEILQYLYRHGPAKTGEITSNVSLSTTEGVRSALYSLMSLDVREPEIEEPIVVKDRLIDTYGLPWQIPDEHDARGAIPVDPHVRRTRILDEITRRIYVKIEDHVEDPWEVVGEIVDRDPGSAYQMKRRAEAFCFPFGSWADTKREHNDLLGVVEAVDVLAMQTDNVSRQLVSKAVAEVFETNDEQELAASLRESILEGQPRVAHTQQPPDVVTVSSDKEDQPTSERAGEGSPQSESDSRSSDSDSVTHTTLLSLLTTEGTSAEVDPQVLKKLGGDINSLEEISEFVTGTEREVGEPESLEASNKEELL